MSFLFKLWARPFFPSLYHREWVKYLSPGAWERGNSGLRVGSFYLAHSRELLRRKQGWSLCPWCNKAELLDFCLCSVVCCVLVATQKLGSYLEIMNAYRYALPMLLCYVSAALVVGISMLDVCWSCAVWTLVLQPQEVLSCMLCHMAGEFRSVVTWSWIFSWVYLLLE